MTPRTYLFVPGNRAERFAKAFATAADAVVLDLEDAVAPDAKAAARHAVADWAAAAGPAHRQRCVVRINDAASPHFADDLRLLRDAGLAVVMLPKAESADQVAAVCAGVRAGVPAGVRAVVRAGVSAGVFAGMPTDMPAGAAPTAGAPATGAAVLALIESARGVAPVAAVAASPGVQRLVFGTIDFALDLGLDIGEHSDCLGPAALQLAMASRLAGLGAPVAGVTPQFDDDTRLLADLAWARRHGFGSKLCIHPRQVAPIHAALAPSPQALDWARRVLAAEAASPGAAQLDGRMIDRPVVLQAQRTLACGQP